MTEFGKTLELIITQMKDWGDKYKSRIQSVKEE